MAPRPPVRRERNNDFSAVGKVGRRTGIVVPKGRLDENGLEEMSGLFSSPRKLSPVGRQVNQISMLEISEAMTGMDSTGLAPTQVLSTRKSLRATSIPPPRSSSPRKTGINGSARRSNGVDVFSPSKDYPTIDPEDRENTPVLSPSRPTQSNVRRFSPSPEKSPLREVVTNGAAPSRSVKGKERAAEALLPSRIDHATAGVTYPDENRQSLGGIRQREAEALGHEEYVDFACDGDSGDMIGKGDLSSASEVTPEDNEEEMHESIEIDEPDEATPSSREQTRRGQRKRKSDSLEEEREMSSEHSPPTHLAKKAKMAMSKRKSRKSSQVIDNCFPVDSNLASQTQKAKVSRAGKDKAQFPTLSSQQEAELGEIIERIRTRPGQHKSLYILRRETPTDNSAVYTRSGRVSVKPLAYWRNERCVYGGSPGGASLSEGARFPLNSIKEIIRTEEVETSRSQTASESKRGGKKAKSRSRATTVETDVNSDSDSEADPAWVDPDAEEWEARSGIYRGDVSIWDHDQQAPLDALEEVELAYAPASIQTREVKSMHPDQRTFKFAKLLSTSFFGSGIVELAPGDLKRPKNSRKMHMSFFVTKGRVAVEVGSLGGEMSHFSVGKGGFWQVPRGNQYSIENKLDKPAKIFFSQACEPVPMTLED